MSLPAALPEIDSDRLAETLLELLAVPSPSGFTEAALRRVERDLDDAGVPWRRTGKGALVWTLEGRGEAPPRAVAAHIDTLGAVVKELKPNGRLKLSAIGGFAWSTVEGAEVTVHPQSPGGGEVVSGTVVLTKQSSHVHGPKLRELERSADTLEVRLDAPVTGPGDVHDLGIEVGDAVAFVSGARRTSSGYLKGRHLDNKAGVAICLEVGRAWRAAGRRPAGDVHVFVSTYEEVGHGGAAGLPAGIAELLCLDMAAVGEGQRSSEHHVTLCVKDGSGPYDAALNAHLRRLAADHGIELRVDVYPHYSSDASAAWRAGGDFRAALIGPGVDASHAFERTHDDALRATARLLSAYFDAPPASGN